MVLHGVAWRGKEQRGVAARSKGVWGSSSSQRSGAPKCINTSSVGPARFDAAMELFTVGYGRWAPRERWSSFVAVLREANVDVLVDVRHSPCSSSLDPENTYGPRDWHLRAEGGGIVSLLYAEGIEYRWLVELGNPQKNDREMRVLREHLREKSASWPVQRGIAELRKLVIDLHKRCCLLCACEDFESCHRSLVAEAFKQMVAPTILQVRDLSAPPRAG